MDAITLSYEDLRSEIHTLAEKFSAKYNLDPDEARAEADFQFVTAYRSYDPERGSLVQRVRFFVIQGLKDWVSQRVQSGRRYEDLALERVPAPEESRLSALVADLSDDARTVMHLVTGAEPRFKNSQRVAGVLRKAGWGVAQITSAFREMREALR
jgi:hypothetical protein